MPEIVHMNPEEPAGAADAAGLDRYRTFFLWAPFRPLDPENWPRSADGLVEGVDYKLMPDGTAPSPP